MPHSSGGGSSGGGFHSGSGSSGGPSYRTSSHYFPGSTCYVYYGRGGLMRTVYLSGDIKSATKSKIATLIAIGAFMLLGVGVAIFAGFHNPHKIATDYATTMLVQDNTDVLTDAEENRLKATFQEFFDASGICPSFVSVENSTWKGHYASLNGYAYDKYLALFKDESHWLIVYSDDGNKTNWAFEGMQGNNTDPVLSGRVTDRFNSYLYNSLSSSTSVGDAVDGAFHAIMPTMMESYFGLDTPMIIFVVAWEGILSVLFVVTLVGAIRGKGLKTATKIDGDVVRKTCPCCGNEYAEGTVTMCPKCGKQLSVDKYATFSEHRPE